MARADFTAVAVVSYEQSIYRCDRGPFSGLFY